MLWGFIRNYAPGATPGGLPDARPAGRLCGRLLPRVREAEEDISRADRAGAGGAAGAVGGARRVAPGRTGEELQTLVYEAGKAHGFADNLRDWFKALYEVLLGPARARASAVSSSSTASRRRAS